MYEPLRRNERLPPAQVRKEVRGEPWPLRVLRQGQLQLVKVLIQAGAQPDLNNGELVKDSEAGEVLE